MWEGECPISNAIRAAIAEAVRTATEGVRRTDPDTRARCLGAVVHPDYRRAQVGVRDVMAS